MSGERFCGSPDCIGPHECLAMEYVGGGGMVADDSFDCPGPAVTFAPEGWDDKTWAPVDEQVESLAHADPPPVEGCCNGRCFRASDVGVSVPGDPVAYPNLLCPEHWGEV